MAGRGRGRANTLPAWMTKSGMAPEDLGAGGGGGGGGGGENVYHHQQSNESVGGLNGQQDNGGYSYDNERPSDHMPGQFDDAPGGRGGGGGGGGGGQFGGRDMDGGYDRRRKRSRSADRDRDRGGRPQRGRRGDMDRDRGRGGNGGGGRIRRPRTPSRSTSRDRERREIRREKRKARGTFWDVKPAGVDDETAKQLMAAAILQQNAPASNLSLSGHPQQMMPIPVMPVVDQATAGSSAVSVSMQQTRHARRLYVGGVPPSADEEDLRGYFNDLLTRATEGRVDFNGGGPVMDVYVNRDRGFAFVELRSIELTTAACGLDGVSFKGAQMKIRRPSDYNPAMVPPVTGPPVYLNMSALGLISTSVPDGPGKIFIGGIPYHLTDEQVKELVTAFGPLKAFHLVRDPGSITSKGYAFAEFMDPTVTNSAIEGLNGLKMGEKTLTVRWAVNQQEVRSAQAYAAQNASIPTSSGAYGGVYGGGGGGGAMGGGGPPMPTADEQLQLAQAMAILDPNAARAVMQNVQAAGAMSYPGADGSSTAGHYGAPAGVVGGGGAGSYGSMAGTGGGMTVGGVGATMQAAAPVAAQSAAVTESAMAAQIVRQLHPTRVLVLLNMVTREELEDPNEYEDIKEDIEGECAKYGAVQKVVLPRPHQQASGKVFVLYTAKEESQRAALSLAGRQFANRIVKAEYYNEQRFESGDLGG